LVTARLHPAFIEWRGNGAEVGQILRFLPREDEDGNPIARRKAKVISIKASGGGTPSAEVRVPPAWLLKLKGDVTLQPGSITVYRETEKAPCSTLNWLPQGHRVHT
jgi:hypothetical protein